MGCEGGVCVGCVGVELTSAFRLTFTPTKGGLREGHAVPAFQLLLVCGAQRILTSLLQISTQLFFHPYMQLLSKSRQIHKGNRR